MLHPSFKSLFSHYNWEQIQEKTYSTTSAQVESVLNSKKTKTPDDFLKLISPVAAPYLEQMAQLSQSITLNRFGKNIQMYIPMYLSNECQNICTYCGFSQTNKIPRTTLSDTQIIEEAKHIKALGFDHVLLVTGEANKSVGVSYIKNAIKLVKPYFANISIEVQPLDTDNYVDLMSAGLHAVLLYQETYNKDVYYVVHPKGKKSNFEYRLDSPERLGAAGIHKIGLGFLIGLTDWRTDAFFTALHLEYLQRRFWKTRFSLSFPRLRPAAGVDLSIFPMSNRELIQLICAYRIFNEHVELSLSTRESVTFRDHAMSLGITSISAGSKTEPGGYVNPSEALEQFEISDNRSPSIVAKRIREIGLEPVWKDWFVM